MKLNVISLSCTALVLMGAGPALAALGGALDSVQADQVHIKGALRVTPSSGFTVHEISTAFGTSVREYSGPGGTVFAVAWDGPVNLTSSTRSAATTPSTCRPRRLARQPPAPVDPARDLMIRTTAACAPSPVAPAPSLLPQNVPPTTSAERRRALPGDHTAMRKTLSLACIPLLLLTACGGGGSLERRPPPPAAAGPGHHAGSERGARDPRRRPANGPNFNTAFIP
jgi:hypothetical protein